MYALGRFYSSSGLPKIKFNANKKISWQSSEEIDVERQYNAAYEYLCHLEEAKLWIEAVLKEPLPPTSELEENLRNGVYLAKIGNFIAPDIVPLSRIYDIFQSRYKNLGLQFRHTDNINYFIQALKSVGFPKMFWVETTDVYDKKNIPKVIYCIHALSAHIFRLGQGPAIKDLYGKIQFSRQEIDSVCIEIEKKSIILPSFQKIGLLLSKEGTDDPCSLHSAIIDINNAIDKQSEEELLKGLTSKAVGLVHVIPEYINHYLSSLTAVKQEKVEAVQNRSLNKSYEIDDYDELLNQSEIQGHIRKVNIDCIWEDILKSIKKNKRENLREIMANSFSEIKDFSIQNLDYYINEALSLDLNQIKSNKSRDAIQTIMQNGNRKAKEQNRVLDAINKVKAAVLSKNKDSLITALRAPALKLSSHISDFASPLYLEELEADLKMSEDLTYRDLKSSIFILNGIAKLTSAVDSRDLDSTWTHLSNPEIPFMNIDPALKTRYFRSLQTCRNEKLAQNLENCLLTFVDIQECIDLTNIEDFQKTQALIYLEEINAAVQASDSTTLLAAMQGLATSVITSDDVPLCMHLLQKRLKQKQLNFGEELWLDDVMAVVEELAVFKLKVSEVVERISSNLTPNSPPQNVLKSIENFGDKYFNNHGLRKTQSKDPRAADPWVVFNIADDIPVYVNTAKKIYKWSKPTDVTEEKFQVVSVSDLKLLNSSNSKTVAKLNANNKDFNAVIRSVTRLQAVIRGYLVRKRVKKKLKAVVLIQKWWRRIKEKQRESVSSEVTSKSSPYDLEHYEKSIDKIIKIQALWRGYKCRKTFPLKRVKPQRNPSFQLLRRLALSNQINSQDYATDLKVQTIKSSVVETIRRNQELACKLEELDMKIGLLVQNKMSVDTVVAEKKNIQTVRSVACKSRGIKAFSKEAKKLLDGYQQLFYLLQTDPAYLTRMIVRLPSSPNLVIQSCVLSLFNHGSNSRDAYFLLRLFRIALYEEVHFKFRKPVDAVTGNPLVLRLAIAFSRQAEGYNPLRNILGFLIEKVINDKVLVDINPVNIYHRWINQTETTSGKQSSLPASVSVEEALTYPEVADRLEHNLKVLKSWVRCFLDRLSHCVDQFPYPLRFIAKLLKDALLQKFPQTSEKDILKIVGNIVFYQYINSAIVAPDAFYIIPLPRNQHLKVEQRQNLANIAKILHFSAIKKGFGEESKYLMSLNPFIIKCHEEMKQFCRNCCAVKDLEEHFKVTKYSEAALIEKPRIYITLEEIRECHKLLLEVKQEVAPDPMDPIHEILDDLGPLPSLATLIGCNDLPESTLLKLGKIQVGLELDNKFQAPPEDPSDAEKLFIKTKELITAKIRDLKGTTLAMAIRDPMHVDLATYLTKLELAGMVKRSNDYADILKSLLKDVSHRQEFRRRQIHEINMLKAAQERLNEKKKFFEDQLAYYEQYLNTCLKNLTAPSNKDKSKKVRSIKYSGTRLREKGVLIALEGVPSSQLKNVQFEISTTHLNGIYSVQGRFMGIEVEKIEIDIQDLLRLQFEGHREMNLFGKAQINVNLLLHLLNKKFLCRL